MVVTAFNDSHFYMTEYTVGDVGWRYVICEVLDTGDVLCASSSVYVVLRRKHLANPLSELLIGVLNNVQDIDTLKAGELESYLWGIVWTDIKQDVIFYHR